MAHRPQGYGLSRELALKTAGKYSDSDEVRFLVIFYVPDFGHIFQTEIIAWFGALNITPGPTERGMDGFQEWLKSGQVLCQLMNTLVPGSIKKIHQTENVKMAVRFMLYLGCIHVFDI